MTGSGEIFAICRGEQKEGDRSLTCLSQSVPPPWVGAGCRCHPGCPHGAGAPPARPLPAPAHWGSYGTGWLWAAWPLSRQLLHLLIFGFAATLTPPSWLGAGAPRSVVASIPPLLPWTSIAPSDYPGLWVTEPLPAGLPGSHDSSNVLSDSHG